MTDLDATEDLAKRAVSLLNSDASDIFYGVTGVLVFQKYGGRPVWYTAFGAAMSTLGELPKPASTIAVAHAVATVVAPIVVLQMSGMEEAAHGEFEEIGLGALYGRLVAVDWLREFNADVPAAFSDAFGFPGPLEAPPPPG